MTPRSLPETNPSLITEMNYRTLMTSKEIPWHNPKHVPISSVPDGWRFTTADESARPPLDALVWFGDMFDGRLAGPGAPLIHRDTYITREPLPEKYRHLVEPEIPAGLPPLPEPPVDHQWVYRGKGLDATGGHYGYTRMGDSAWSTGRIAGGAQGLHYIEAVKIEEPAKDAVPDPDAHKLAVLIAARANKPTQRYSNAMGWVPCDDVDEVLTAIADGERVRIKPEPVRVPLSDYGIGEAVKHEDHGIGIICRIDSHAVKVEFHDRELFFTRDAMSRECLIHRRGTWQDCFRIEEGGK